MCGGEAEKLLKEAERVLSNAYSPYSGYRVAAAVLSKDGRIFTGVNIENSSYGLTICAERVAIFNAVSAGCKNLSMIAIVSDNPDIPPYPCGACRQVMAEFNKDIKIVIKKSEKIIELSLTDLLPYSFDFKK
ncbi:MAG: cytidine deaminase [candidate division WOR-3 bacterium]